MVQSINPRTGLAFGPVFEDTSLETVDALIAKSQVAFALWSTVTPAERASVLELVADGIDSHAAALVEVADLETGLGSPRLTGEVARTTFQIREFARAIKGGQFVMAQADPFVEGAPPAGHPEFIRTLQPLGPVVVFGANNFPFAFSVLGGDTASALAAGCTVIAKAHPSHPQTSTQVYEIAAAILAANGFPAVLTLFHGVEAGAYALKSEAVMAGAFTGSLRGGRALFDIASSREVPIPFYGELGSVNPVVALASGLSDPKGFATAYLDSLLLGNGQFCTNPSILFVPAESPVLQEIADQVAIRKPSPFLSPATKKAHDAQREVLATTLTSAPILGDSSADSGIYSAPAVIFTDLEVTKKNPEVLRVECFGPTGVVVSYSELSALLEQLAELEGALTGSLFASAEDENVAAVVKALAKRVGRVSWNSWPTGVAVSVGQQHGGPYPASTNSLHTSVGLHAISRFLRPVTFQNFPATLVAHFS